MCSKHSIREDELDTAVLTTIRRQIEVVLDMDRALLDMDRLAWEQFEIKKMDAKIDIQKEIIEKIMNCVWEAMRISRKVF